MLYIGGEPLGDVGEPMTVRVVLDGLGDVYELERATGGLLWGLAAEIIRPDTEPERTASAARVAAAIAKAIGRRAWRREQIAALKGELSELEREEFWLDPDPADVIERERVSRALLAQAQAIAAHA